MSLFGNIRDRAKSVALQVLGAALVVYFGYHLVSGDRGLLAWLKLDEELATSEKKLAALHMKRQALAHRVGLMRREHIDADMLDEQVRRMLNLSRRDEIIIYDKKSSK